MPGFRLVTLIGLFVLPSFLFSQKAKKLTYTFTVTMIPQSCGGREISAEEEEQYVKQNSKVCDREYFNITDIQKPSVILKRVKTDNYGCFVFTAEEGTYSLVLDSNNYLVPADCRASIVSRGFRMQKKSSLTDRQILLVIPTPDCCKGQLYE